MQCPFYRASEFLDSQYVLDILQGRDIRSQNLPLVNMVLDYYTYLQTQSHVTLHKVKSHTGIEGDEKADLNANNGVNRRTYLGRYASFPPAPPRPLPEAPIQDLPPDLQTSHLVHALATAMDSSFPKQQRNTRKPYISENTLDLLSQITPVTPPQALKLSETKFENPLSRIKNAGSRIDSPRNSLAPLLTNGRLSNDFEPNTNTEPKP